MVVSSNVLTHFTNNISNIENILTHNFIPRLCKENFSFLSEDSRDILIPMVCFCDIPLHLIHEHISDYGAYGLGLSKDWGIKNGLNPIIYLEKETLLSKSFNEIFENISDLNSPDVEKNANILVNFFKIYCLLKPYQGTGKNGKKKIFYEEREWRYIPKSLHKTCTDGDMLGLTLFGDEVTKEKKNEIEEILNNEPLIFQPGDVKYIFIDNENERKNIIDMIKKIKSAKYPPEEIEILCSKIISYNQFSKDL